MLMFDGLRSIAFRLATGSRSKVIGVKVNGQVCKSRVKTCDIGNWGFLFIFFSRPSFGMAMTQDITDLFE